MTKVIVDLMIYNIARHSARLFVTCSKNDIRIWDLETSKEMRRFTQPNMTCNCVTVSDDGKTVVSGERENDCRWIS